jgi:hypothetical protein
MSEVLVRTSLKTLVVNGAPGMIRTCDHLIRSQVLYPAELRVRRPRII